MATAQAYQQQCLVHDQTFNAEQYHLNQAQQAGYVTAEALQFVLGPELLKGAVKAGSGLMGLGVVRGGSILPGVKLAGREKKLMQHARDWYGVAKGANPTKEQLGMMEKLIRHIHQNTSIIKQGAWRGGINEALFYSNGKHIVVTQSDGTFITFLKNAHGENGWFNKAATIWSK